MWPPILLIATICVSSLSGRTMGPMEGPLWSEALEEALGDPDGANNLEEVDNIFRSSYEDHRETENNLVADNSHEDFNSIVTAVLPASQKRALSMFARWSTINSLGKGRTPIRSKVLLHGPAAEGGLVSAQTRGRMLGQPLRWG